jgi:hypothetical protein
MSANRYGVTFALKEHMARGNPITGLEAIVFFGVASLTKTISIMRNEGWIIKSKKIPYKKVLVRINRHSVVQPPPNLPIDEIVMTEYWVQK